jgi:hypothetical protein
VILRASRERRHAAAQERRRHRVAGLDGDGAVLEHEGRGLGHAGILARAVGGGAGRRFALGRRPVEIRPRDYFLTKVRGLSIGKLLKLFESTVFPLSGKRTIERLVLTAT